MMLSRLWIAVAVTAAWVMAAQDPSSLLPQLSKREAGGGAKTAARKQSSRTKAPAAKTPAAKMALPASASAERLNMLGAGYMGMQDFARARQYFVRAYQRDPKFEAARLNDGIALLNQQKYPAAKQALSAAASKRPHDPRVWYNLGLLYKSQGNPQAALEAFEKAVAADAADADSRYFAGQMLLDLKRYPEAARELEEALRLDRFQLSAEYALARTYQRMGEPERSRQHVLRFQKLAKENVGTPLGIGYGQQGKYSLVEAVETQPPTAKTAAKVEFVKTDVGIGGAVSTASATQKLGGPICVFDYDEDGRPDIFVVRDGRTALFHNVKGANGPRLNDVTATSGLPKEAAVACAAGHIDNHGGPSLALAFRGHLDLYRNEGAGRFKDISGAAAIPAGIDATALEFVDYDHDGDLDLYVVTAAGNHLLRNNGDGKFSDVTDAVLKAEGGKGSADIATDINNDRAVDLVVAGAWPPTILFNQREGKFSAAEMFPPPSSSLPPSASVVAFDFDKDGWMDLAITHTGAPGLSLWRNVKGRSLERVPLPELGFDSATSVAALDYDNDGWLDLAVVGVQAGAAKVIVLRNRGGNFEDVSAATGLDAIGVAAGSVMAVADLDGDGDADLLLSQPDGSVIEQRNDGGNRNSWAKLWLKGNADNRSAYGAQVEVFSGAGHQKFEVAPSGGRRSQNEPVLNVGLGGERFIDRLRMRWPTGVVQDEVLLPARTTHRVNEIDRRSSSCPLLFTWNGSRFEFISDMIGPAVVGHWVAPNQTNAVDPDEYVKVEGRQLQARNGRLSVSFLEPMEEVNYLDQLRLVAVDHPAEEAVYPNERFTSAPPFPEAKVVASRAAKPPLAARDGNGNDVLPQLLRRDRQYVKGFKRLKFFGFAEPHTLELGIEPVDSALPLRLVMHGFTEYFTANSMFAAYQAGLQPFAPYLEAQAADGTWKRVSDDIGFPAGLPRTMIADLSGKLPAGTRRIRLVTNLQIYWDQILVDTTAEADASRARQSEVPLLRAELRRPGFPKQIERRTAGDLTYDYALVSPTGPFAFPQGNYTRFGDVLPLLGRSDDKFVIFGPGEEVRADFDARALPPLPSGWRRDYFFYADGFVKDMDVDGTAPFTVDPLPFHGMSAYPYPAGESYPLDDDHLRYLLEYNDRFIYERTPGTYRFQYGVHAH